MLFRYRSRNTETKSSSSDVAYRICGIAAPWHCSPVVLRPRGIMAPWHCGPVALWPCGIAACTRWEDLASARSALLTRFRRKGSPEKVGPPTHLTDRGADSRLVHLDRGCWKTLVAGQEGQEVCQATRRRVMKWNRMICTPSDQPSQCAEYTPWVPGRWACSIKQSTEEEALEKTAGPAQKPGVKVQLAWHTERNGHGARWELYCLYSYNTRPWWLAHIHTCIQASILRESQKQFSLSAHKPRTTTIQIC